MAKKILIIDNNEISINQIKFLLESSNYLVYHTNTTYHIADYIKELNINLIIINQNLFVKEDNILDRMYNIKIPVVILASIFFDNIKKELSRLSTVTVIRLPKADKEILKTIETLIVNHHG